MHIIVGLGNPGEKYETSRHNTGRMVVSDAASAWKFPEFVNSGKYQGHISEGKVAGEKTLLLLPDTFMNKSGIAVKQLIKTQKAAQKLIVVYDDIDLPIGLVRVSFGRGSGGHRGIESIIKHVKTKDFVRIRVGVSPSTPGGKLKKPKGGELIVDFLMGDFKKPEAEIVKKQMKAVREAIEIILSEGHVRAMNVCN